MNEPPIPAQKTRELWIDNVKAFACILVLLGHLLLGLAESGLTPYEGIIAWIILMVYHFHVPLFFLCSGYLYQRRSQIHSVKGWAKSTARKLLELGVPYVAFTLIVWTIKTLLSGAGNSQAYGLGRMLLIQPTAPYWYLYCLFFIFLITLPFRSRAQAILWTVAALIMKALAIAGVSETGHIVTHVLTNEIWFVLGMLLSMTDAPKKVRGPVVSILAGLVFLGASFVAFDNAIVARGFSFAMGLLACFAVIGLFIWAEKSGRRSRAIAWLSKYTMPIFLMHSIFVATLRSILVRLGIVSVWVHIPAGIAIGIAGPIVAAILMKKLKYPEFLMYPGKFIKIK